MHYFDHNYSQIWQTLNLPKLETILLRHDLTLKFKIAKRTFLSPEINQIFLSRNITYNLRNPLPHYRNTFYVVTIL